MKNVLRLMGLLFTFLIVVAGIVFAVSLERAAYAQLFGVELRQHLTIVIVVILIVISIGISILDKRNT